MDQNEIDNSSRRSDIDDAAKNNSAHPSIIDTTIDATSDSSPNHINEQIDTNEIIGSETRPPNNMENRNEISIDAISCDRDNGGCEQKCNIVPGEGDRGNVIECSCHDGFYLEADGGSKCLGKSSFLR